jgi:tripartite-type tricarboxylate transporter receptor subunit TctC
VNLPRRKLLSSLLTVVLGGVAFTAGAQPAWPARPVTLVVPYSAGGSLDATTRLVASRLAERIGQQVLVENVTGAGGSLGFAKVMQAAPDGHTFLMAGDSPLNPNAPAGGPTTMSTC